MSKYSIYIIGLFFLFSSGFSQVYTDWSHQYTVTIRTNSPGADISDNLTDYPLLVRLNSSNFNFGAAKSDGSDIRFSTSGSSPSSLEYEIERWDSQAEEAEIWVMIPHIQGNSTTDFLMYHGNPLASDISSPEDVFTPGTGFIGVWHMAESSGDANDATENTESLSEVGTISQVAGQIGNSREFENANGEYLISASGFSLDFGRTWTASFWVSADDINDMGILSKGDDDADWNYRESQFYLNTTSHVSFVGRNRGDNKADPPEVIPPGYIIASSHPLTNDWTHVTVQWEDASNTRRIFINGSTVTLGTIDYDSDVSDDDDEYLFIGRNISDEATSDFDGKLDEIRLSDNLLAADWIKMDYESQKAGSEVLVITPSPGNNNNPVDLSLSTVKFESGQPAGTLVGSFSTFDADSTDTHSYSLVTGTGDTDNSRFSVISGQLYVSEVIAEGNYSIRVSTDDNAGGTFEKSLTLTATAPGSIYPGGLAYQGGNSMHLGVGIPVSGKFLTHSTGQDPTSVAISPALPAGLVLNEVTGEISGTPTGISPRQNYTVTVQPGGATLDISISVALNTGPPSSLSYSSGSPVTWYIGETVVSNTLSYNGETAISISVNNLMPPGLTFNTGTGAITGTPLGPVQNYQFIITVTNNMGAASDTLVVSIAEPVVAPVCQGYSSSDFRFLMDYPVDPQAFAHTGTEISDISISPVLPSGLDFDSAGTLTGTPTVTDTGNYVVTVTNTVGFCSDTFNLQILDPGASLPGIDSVTSISPDREYQLGEVITVTLHFTHRMTLDSGNLIIQFETGQADHTTIVPVIQNQDSVTFTYTVLNGDRTDRLTIKNITLSDSTTTFEDEFGRTVNLLLDTPENLAARHKISLVAADASLNIDTAAAGGNDTIMVGTEDNITMIVPAIPTLSTMEIFTLNLYENTDNRPGDEVGPITVWRDLNGNPLIFETPITIRLQIDTTKVLPDYPLSSVYLYIAPENEGDPWIRVEAAREGSELVYTTQSLNVTMVGLDKDPPEVILDPNPPVAISNGPLPIAFTMQDNVADPMARVIIHSDSKGLPDITIDASAGSAVIPAEYVNPYGLWYLVEVDDGANKTYSDTVDVTLLATDAKTATKTVSPGSYQMVSIPLNPVDKTIQTLFIDDYGEPNIKRWRMFDFDGKEFKDMIPSSEIKVGRAYWLKVQGDPMTVSTEPLQLRSLPVSRPFNIDVHQGWNTISNPFLLPVLSSSIETGGKPLTLYDLSDSGWVADTEGPHVLEPWRGYVFKNPAPGDVGHIRADSFAVVPDFDITRAGAKRKNTGEVLVKLYVRQGPVADGLLMMGYNYNGSTLYRDHNDHLKPGMGPIHLKTHLLLPGEESGDKKWLTDIRGKISEGYTWNFIVNHSGEGEVALHLSGLEGVAARHGSWLLDIARNKVIVLKKGSSAVYPFTSMSSHNENFALVVGTSEYLENRLEVYQKGPDFTLGQNYPNPFRTRTKIAYAVPAPDKLNLNGSTVNLQIYDIRGHLVKTLVSNKKQLPGTYHVSWDAENDPGNALPAGIYIYRLNVNGTHIRHKFMTLLK